MASGERHEPSDHDGHDAKSSRNGQEAEIGMDQLAAGMAGLAGKVRHVCVSSAGSVALMAAVRRSRYNDSIEGIRKASFRSFNTPPSPKMVKRRRRGYQTVALLITFRRRYPSYGAI